jgi:hypothetical protein
MSAQIAGQIVCPPTELVELAEKFPGSGEERRDGSVYVVKHNTSISAVFTRWRVSGAVNFRNLPIGKVTGVK